jgi:adenosylmethionine-8-amino-7-oxononanoate aminotransferase
MLTKARALTLAQRDAKVIWHPFTQHQIASEPLAITRGQGAYLFTADQKKYLDLISSWWVNLHGHGEATIAAAIHEQALQLEHVLFAGCTHEPAVQLAEQLLAILPDHFSKIFYSDNGSTAVEIALKMAYHYWQNQGQPLRRKFIAFDNGYHGDTFGAMAISRQSGFFAAFDNLLFPVTTYPYPDTWIDDADILRKEETIINNMAAYLAENGQTIAAVILEPLVQGASGMHMCRPQFLQRLQDLVKQYDILLIYDEVMTGFGRTGNHFACITAQTQPDIICLAKGLTGGFLPLAVTSCAEFIYQAFLGDSFAKALAHGHSFTANPLGCAAALASLQILKQDRVAKNIAAIAECHQTNLQKLLAHPNVLKPRYCGTIAAFDLTLLAEYGSVASKQLQQRFLDHGLLVRPLGKTIYLLPPYCVSVAELQNAYDIITDKIIGDLTC